jgi:acyl-ACP thioesterase
VNESPLETEFVAVPQVGRTFVRSRTVRTDDVSPHGFQRLDSLARYVQDIATQDASEALSGSAFAYVLRRLSMRIDRAPRLSERLTLTTFCGGIAHGWAERRTSIRGDGGALVETAAIWVPIDSAGRPVRLPPDFLAAYGAAAQGRRASARLVHAAIPADQTVERRTWALRFVDLDILNHVNNAAHWCAVEEILAGKAVRRADIEFVSPLLLGEPCELVTSFAADLARVGDRLDLWLCGEGHVRSSMRVWMRE